jgi:hypothetical protein
MADSKLMVDEADELCGTASPHAPAAGPPTSSRRFYSTLLLSESPPADQHVCASRRKFGLPPSAMRPWFPDFGAVKATDGGGKGHGRGRTAGAGAVC